jgi:hypothetical protein
LQALGKTDTMKQRIASLDLENELFNDVFEKDASGKILMPENADLPVVFKYYQVLNSQGKPGTVLMRLQNGLPFLIYTNAGKGRLYLFTCPVNPAFTNFQQHLMFVPVIYRMAFLSGTQTPLYYISGKNFTIDLPSDSVNEKNIVKISTWNNSSEFIPELRSNGQQTQALVHDQIKEAGWYQVNRSGKQLSVIAYNYDRKESEITCFTTQEIETNLSKFKLRNVMVMKPSGLPFATQMEHLNSGFPFWKWLIIFSLLFIGAEIAIIRFYKP